jgi:hypothetical protein
LSTFENDLGDEHAVDPCSPKDKVDFYDNTDINSLVIYILKQSQISSTLKID